MLSRLVDAAADAELHAFEAVDRCCAEARADYLVASSDVERHRRLALQAVMAGDVRSAVSLARREGEAEAARRVAWSTYRESYALLLALVNRTAALVTRDDLSLAATG